MHVILLYPFLFYFLLCLCVVRLPRLRHLIVTFFKASGVGAKIPKSCMFYHIPLESFDIEQSLRFKGYNGNRRSVWAIQVINSIIFFSLLNVGERGSHSLSSYV